MEIPINVTSTTDLNEYAKNKNMISKRGPRKRRYTKNLVYDMMHKINVIPDEYYEKIVNILIEVKTLPINSIQTG